MATSVALGTKLGQTSFFFFFFFFFLFVCFFFFFCFCYFFEFVPTIRNTILVAVMSKAYILGEWETHDILSYQ